jgi:hypothetical protein
MNFYECMLGVENKITLNDFAKWLSFKGELTVEKKFLTPF